MKLLLFEAGFAATWSVKLGVVESNGEGPTVLFLLLHQDMKMLLFEAGFAAWSVKLGLWNQTQKDLLFFLFLLLPSSRCEAKGRSMYLFSE
jgi:hypothetical protein